MDRKLANINEERVTYTVLEAAKILGLSRSGAFEAVKRGFIPHLRIGKRILIPRAAIEKMLEKVGSDGNDHNQ